MREEIREGGRARIGLLVPSSCTTMERDLQVGLADSGTIFSARMFLAETTEAGESAMLDDYLPQALTDLATLHPHIVVFGCTSAGALRGPEYEERLCMEITAQTGAPTISTMKAVNEALVASGRKEIAILTPYVDDLNRRVKASVEASGLVVREIEGFGITDNFHLATPTSEEIAERGLALVDRTSPELLFISCTNFRGLAAAPAIEQATGVPVLTSNGAVIAAVRDELARAVTAAE